MNFKGEVSLKNHLIFINLKKEDCQMKKNELEYEILFLLDNNK